MLANVNEKYEQTEADLSNMISTFDGLLLEIKEKVNVLTIYIY